MNDFSYELMDKARIPCVLCGSGEFDTLCRNDRYWMGLQTAACRKCGLIMTNPAPTPAALSDFYKTHYRRLYRRVNRPTPAHIRKYELDRRASYAAAYMVERGLIESRRSVLDVGCAEGSLLKEILRRVPGTRTVGVEPGEGFADFCRAYAGCEVFPTLEEVKSRNRGPFDCVVVIHVLEHVDHPVHFLRSLRDFLSPGGSIYVDVPDAGEYRSLDDLHLAHLFHFTPRTLAETARQAGYCVADMNRHQPPRHPASLRCILRTTGAEAVIPQDPGEDERTRGRIATFDRTLFSYRLKRSFPIRLVTGALRRLAGLFRR